MTKEDCVAQRKILPINGPLLRLLYLCELSAIFAVFALYRSAGKPDVLSFIGSRPGVVFLATSLVCILSVVGITQQVLKGYQAKSGLNIPTLAANFVTVCAIFALAELTVRLSVSRTQPITAFGNIPLRPRMWEEMAARYSEIAKRIADYEPFFVGDDLLGWTVGSSRRSEDGLLLSSVEGIRSSKAGVTYTDRPAACRIALVGDSFTLHEETTFDSSWGRQLEQRLPAGCQVLNFGVSYYGIGQMYLRYMRDVRPWHANIVILAVTFNAEFRTMGVYAFLGWPGSPVPWAKPHFVLKDKRIELINLPLPSSEKIFSVPSITGLPFIEYDWNYKQTEWDLANWRPFYFSYLFRLITSLYPLSEVPREATSMAAVRSINREILRSFVREVSSAGSIPIVLYLPREGDYSASPSSDRFMLEILHDTDIEFTDLTPCLGELSASERFLKPGNDRHHSPQGAIRLAECVSGIVVPRLSGRDVNQRTGGDLIPTKKLQPRVSQRVSPHP